MLEQSATQLLIPQLDLWTTANPRYSPELNRQNKPQQGPILSLCPILTGSRVRIDHSVRMRGCAARLTVSAILRSGGV